MKTTCPKCHGVMKPSIALENMLNKPNAQDWETVSKTGAVVVLDCLKCSSCGHSIRPINNITKKLLGDFVN